MLNQRTTRSTLSQITDDDLFRVLKALKQRVENGTVAADKLAEFLSRPAPTDKMEKRSAICKELTPTLNKKVSSQELLSKINGLCARARIQDRRGAVQGDVEEEDDDTDDENSAWFFD